LILETHVPPAPFDELIESILHFRGFQPDHSIERVVPTGHVFAIFELDGFERHTFDNETLDENASFQKAWLSGAHRKYLSISAHENSEMFVIQFKAYGAYPFLQVPMDEVADRVISGADLLDGEMLDLREALFEAGSSNDKFAVADRWLEKRYDAKLAPPESMIKIVKLLQSEPAAKFSEIIEEFDGSQKHLISLFRKYIGQTPKQYQRVLRFNDVFVQMQNDQFLSWSDIAYRCGYSDQSHFIREFKMFSGFNPQSFLKQDFDVDTPTFFPLDRDG